MEYSYYKHGLLSRYNYAKDIIEGAGADSTQNTYNTLYPGRSENSNVMGRSETRERSNARTNAANNGGTLGGQVLDV